MKNNEEYETRGRPRNEKYEKAKDHFLKVLEGGSREGKPSIVAHVRFEDKLLHDNFWQSTSAKDVRSAAHLRGYSVSTHHRPSVVTMWFRKVQK